METKKIVSLEDRIPKLKEKRKKKANRRAIILLAVFFILLIFVLYFLSPLSNISTVEVKGNDYLTKDAIIEASRLSEDVSIWKVDKEAISDRLKKSPYIKDVEISIVFPNSVRIKVDEYRKIAYLVTGSDYYPVLSNAKLIDPHEEGAANLSAPLLYGFKEGDKALESIIGSLEKLPEEIVNAISEINHDPTDTDSYHVMLYMNDGYEVSANSKTLAQKLIHYPSIVSQLKEGEKGIIDLEVGSYFRSYETEGGKEGAEETEEAS
ncbi:MAG: cell division protein FtsQ/DivIB [Bacillus sp. (in: firmicutes)]